MSVAEELQARVRERGLLAQGRPVVVLLSGGRDSTCLLDLAVSVSGAAAVTALHINYGLRESAAADQSHCEQLCERLGVPLHTVHPPDPARGNVQAWARQVRYQAADRAAQAADADVAAGHTAGDQLETIVYRLISSPSRRALLGMRERDGRLIRPLLQFTRAQTGEYCTELGLRWRDDETNDTGKYVRNRIRNELIPLICELHPGADGNLLALAQVLAEEQQALDLMADAALQGADRIALGDLAQLPVGVARIVVQRLADSVNGRPTPGTARRLHEILALSSEGTAHLDLPGAVRATVVSGVLSFGTTDAKSRDRKQP